MILIWLKAIFAVWNMNFSDFWEFFQVDFNRLIVNAPLKSIKSFWSITIDLKNLEVRESYFMLKISDLHHIKIMVF